MRAILLQNTRVSLDKIASYWAGPAGPNSGQIYLSMVGDAPDATPWIFADPGGMAIDLLDRLFQLAIPRQGRS